MDVQSLRVALDTLWVLMTAFLVFFMNLGFAMVESGLCRAKNTVNILAKNFIVFAVSSLAYYVLGFGLMFGDGNGLIGLQGLLAARGPDNSPATGDAYRGAYAALSLDRRAAARRSSSSSSSSAARRPRSSRAPWPSGSSSRPSSSSRSSSARCSTRSPATGSGAGAGSRRIGMLDFAGSTVVHSVGGWAALAGILRARSADRAVPGRRLGPAHVRPQHEHWRPSACSCSGSAGSASTPARRWR